MARSSRRPTRVSRLSFIQVIRRGPSPAAKGLFVAALGIAAGVWFWWSPGSRGWFVESLGYGWIPVGIWLAVAMSAIVHYRSAVRKSWRWCVAAAALAAISIGVLSLLHAGSGTLAETGLSGRWGQLLGGSPIGLAVAKLAAIALLSPLALLSRPVGRAYWRGLIYVGLAFYYTPVYIYKGLHHGWLFVDRRVRPLVNPAPVWRFLTRTSAAMFRWVPGSRRRRQGAPKAANSPGSDSWADTEAGSIPSWPSEEETLPVVAAPAGQGASQRKGPQWQLPSLELLSPPETRETSQAVLEDMGRNIESTLTDHGVVVEVKEIKAGPRVVQFGLVPGWLAKKRDAAKGDDEDSVQRSRIKVRDILGREQDLALALQTPYLRIEAPIPGEGLVGLEVPHPSPAKVHLREVMSNPSFNSLVAKNGLPMAIGQDAGGAPVSLDLAALPHMLIAGATGSGKSVCINSIIASFLLTKLPDQLRFLMVDPKRVELTPFNGIPHLMAPVITEIDEVNTALLSLMREMFRRYKVMEDVGVRNLSAYNKKAQEPWPYLVLVVDELADLMIAGGFEVEQNLVRLAQLGRATGIHLVLATQRPSVNVVTGLLKANIPTRIAFAVASQVDSRVILDTVGAEKLLGKGDMLLLNNESPKPRRVQATLVYDKEVEELVDHWVKQEGPPLPVISMSDPEAEDDDDDPDDRLMDQARDLAVRLPNLSSSLLERRLKIGGSRAAQLIESLEDEGLLVSR